MATEPRSEILVEQTGGCPLGSAFGLTGTPGEATKARTIAPSQALSLEAGADVVEDIVLTAAAERLQAWAL
jgi:hypothetical protein